MDKTSDRHGPVIGVVAFVPTFLDSCTIVGVLPSDSVTTSSHVPILKQNSHHTPIPPKGKGDNAKAAGVRLFRALVRRLNPFFISKCLLQVKVIHQTVMAVIRTVNYRWLLRTGPRYSTAESARANHKFKGTPGSCTVRSPWIRKRRRMIMHDTISSIWRTNACVSGGIYRPASF
jgi:hypothetical protein